MQLSKNFTLEEFVRSETANKYKIDNTPSAAIIEKLRVLAKNALQPIRDYYNKPIIITSGYRCPALNRKMGGLTISQHTLGEAVDFIIPDKTVDNLIKVIPQIIDFDQLIKKRSGKKEWVFMSYKYNRREVLTIIN